MEMALIDLSISDANERFQSLMEAKAAAQEKLVSMLHFAKISAIGLEEAGDPAGAYAAYARILEQYYKIGDGACNEIKGVLARMARLAWANKDELHAQELAWKALSHRWQPPRAHPSDINLLKDIGKSLSQTWPEVKRIVQSEMNEHFIQKCNQLLPPLHRMMESPYASQVSGNIFLSGPHPNVTGKSPESPIVGGIDAILDFLEVFSDAQIEERDGNRRTALFFAALHCKEGLGLALMTRAKNDPIGLLRKLVTSRDDSGQTVLSASISNRCSVPFIKALIDNGADVSPVTVSLAMTPLQAACSINSLEIVDLLVTRGASIDAAYPGSRTPLAIAEQHGNLDIVNRLNYTFPGHSGFQRTPESDHEG